MKDPGFDRHHYVLYEKTTGRVVAVCNATSQANQHTEEALELAHPGEDLAVCIATQQHHGHNMEQIWVNINKTPPCIEVKGT